MPHFTPLDGAIHRSTISHISLIIFIFIFSFLSSSHVRSRKLGEQLAATQRDKGATGGGATHARQAHGAARQVAAQKGTGPHAHAPGPATARHMTCEQCPMAWWEVLSSTRPIHFRCRWWSSRARDGSTRGSRRSVCSLARGEEDGTDKVQARQPRPLGFDMIISHLKRIFSFGDSPISCVFHPNTLKIGSSHLLPGTKRVLKKESIRLL